MKTILRPFKALYLKWWVGGDMFGEGYTWSDVWRIADLLEWHEW